MILKPKKIFVALTNDISTDYRVHKICSYLVETGFEVLVYGRVLPNTIAVNRAYKMMIPLSSGKTSVGIVTQNDLHDFSTYSRSYQTSFEWLKENEPRLAEYLGNKEPLDFRKIKNYSYGSEQLFSGNGWSCVGEAGIFSDPFYSPGSDMIAITNTFTTNLIGLAIEEKLETKKVNQLNDFILETMFPDQLSYYVGGYHTFGNTQVSSSKFLWDTLYYWRVYAHAFMCGVFEDFEKLQVFESYVKQFSQLNKSLQIDLKIWAESTESKNTFDYADLARKEVFIESAISLLTRPSEANFEKHLRQQLEFFSILKSQVEDSHAEVNTQKQGPFAQFYGNLSSSAKRKNNINGAISQIAGGDFLYGVRNIYIKLLVKGKERVHLSWMLRLLYAD